VARRHHGGGFIVACPRLSPCSGSCCGQERNAREKTLAVPSTREKPAGSRLARRRRCCLAGGVWVVVTFLYSPHPPPQAPDVNVEAPGGVAAGRDIRGSTITVHPSAPPGGSAGNADPAPRLTVTRRSELAHLQQSNATLRKSRSTPARVRSRIAIKSSLPR
jgi:hypothetical protein